MSFQEKDPDRIYFANLDLLRLLAAMMVVILHAYEGWCGWWGYLDFMSTGPDHQALKNSAVPLHNIIKNGMFGVEIFFLISGFLITYILLKEKESTGRINIKNFFIRRGLRIWPLYFLIVGISPLLVSWLHKPAPDYLSTIFFFNNFHTIATGNWEFPFAHFWSICIEEHFYLVWPFIIAFIPKKHLLSVFWTVIIISIFVRFGFSLDPAKGFYHLYLHTLSKMDILAIGAMGAYLYHLNLIRFIIPKFVRVCLYVLFLVMFGYEAYFICNGTFLAAFRNYFYIGIAAMGMLNFLFNPDALIKIRKKTVFHYLGKISYGIYMYSNILVTIIIEKIILPNNLYNFYIYMLLNIVLSIVISIISYELFEKQFLKLKSKFEVIKTRR